MTDYQDLLRRLDFYCGEWILPQEEAPPPLVMALLYDMKRALEVLLKELHKQTVVGTLHGKQHDLDQA